MNAVILTKSRMNNHGVSGVCTTAFDLDSGRVLRFVSNREGAPIGYPYNNAYECLDVVNVKILDYCPIRPQMENALVDQKSFKILRKYNGDKSDIVALFGLIQIIQDRCLQYMYDYPDVVTYKLRSVDKYNHSIEIKKVSNLILKRSEWGSTSASFLADTENGIRTFKYYPVTDARYELKKTTTSEKVIGDAYIVVSIPYSPHDKDGYFYKFVAAIYPM